MVLAVSGGRDSMCLLHAAANHPRRTSRIVVASFDHGTGVHSRDAVRLVRETAHALGLEFVGGTSGGREWSEAAWREARWSFLLEVAAQARAVIATAHHHDDHIETVVMRALRGAGARGLAGLRVAPRAEMQLRRPFLGVEGRTLRAYAVAHRLRWIEDPTNDDPSYLRNRVRRDLLPALEAAHPHFARSMDQLSARAAQLRGELDRTVATLERGTVGGVVRVDPMLLSFPAEGRALLWGAVLQRAGVVLDRRGYERLGELADMEAGDEVQLSGRVSVARTTHFVCIHRHRGTWTPRQLGGGTVRVGPWRFAVCEARGVADTWGAWGWPAPAQGVSWLLRPWRGGDRWRGPGCDAPRLVARFLAEAGVPASAREGWPVVETNGEIVWVPGTRRAPAAPASPGGVFRLVRCDFIDR